MDAVEIFSPLRRVQDWEGGVLSRKGDGRLGGLGRGKEGEEGKGGRGS